MSKALSMARRGVLMTASGAKKRGSWKDQEPGVEIGDSDPEDEDEVRKASQLEWKALEQEVQTDMRKKELASGIRHSAVVNYDDVAGDEDEDDEEDDGSRSASPSQEADAPSAKGAVDEDGERVVPEGVTTAGITTGEVKEKKRGGKKETGATKRKRKYEGEDGPAPKKKKEDEDPDRWLKLKLQGEEKPKRIDTTRIVHYHDFDDRAMLEATGSSAAAEEKPAAIPGSFRSSIRRDLFDDSSDDE